MKTLEKLVLGATSLVSLSGCGYFPYETGVQERVVVYPLSPEEGDTLHCRVDGASEDIFDFSWFVNREFIKIENGVAGLLEPGYAFSGDYVECSVWIPANSQYGPVSLGSDGVYIP